MIKSTAIKSNNLRINKVNSPIKVINKYIKIERKNYIQIEN